MQTEHKHLFSTLPNSGRRNGRELAGCPPYPGARSPGSEKGSPSLRAYSLRDRRLVPHPHFVHNLESCVHTMPRSLKNRKKIRFRHYVTIKKKQLPCLFRHLSIDILLKASKLLHKLASQAVCHNYSIFPIIT